MRIWLLAQLAVPFGWWWVKGVYAGKVRQHNMLHHQPDAMHSIYSPLQPPRSLAGIKFVLFFPCSHFCILWALCWEVSLFLQDFLMRWGAGTLIVGDWQSSNPYTFNPNRTTCSILWKRYVSLLILRGFYSM